MWCLSVGLQRERDRERDKYIEIQLLTAFMSDRYRGSLTAFSSLSVGIVDGRPVWRGKTLMGGGGWGREEKGKYLLLRQ